MASLAIVYSIAAEVVRGREEERKRGREIETEKGRRGGIKRKKYKNKKQNTKREKSILIVALHGTVQRAGGTVSSFLPFDFISFSRPPPGGGRVRNGGHPPLLLLLLLLLLFLLLPDSIDWTACLVLLYH